MPHINEMSSGKYLKKEDVEDREMLVTIKDCVQENVAMENQSPDHKWVLRFYETDKGLVLNKTNLSLAAAITGENTSEAWVGKRIVLWNDSNIMFQGKKTGGVRIKAANVSSQRPSPAPSLQEQHQPNPEYDGGEQTPPDDEIPF